MILNIFDLKLLACLLPWIMVCKSETLKKCPYDYTVDLTGVVPYANGSYKYEDILIPASSVGIYESKALVNGTVVGVTNQTRGCICSVRRCLRVCSDSLLNFYNDGKYDFDAAFTKSVTLSNGTETKKHLIHDFHHIVKSVCVGEYPLDPERQGDKWTLFENGTLLRHGDQVYLGQEDYCFDAYNFMEHDDYFFLVNPFNCGDSELSWNLLLNGYAMLCSIPFFVATIVFYSCVPHLRTVHGKCFICYLSWLAVSFFLLSFLIISSSWDRLQTAGLCKSIGFLLYFTFSSYLTWSCVISYDTWKTLTATHLMASSCFCKYFVVGLLVPLIMTVLTMAAQIFIPYDYLKPGIDDDHCGVETRRWSACIYYYIPSIVVFIFSLTLYIRVLIFILRHKRSVSTLKDDDNKSNKKRFLLYFRLFIFMGVVWGVDIASFFWSMTEQNFFAFLPDLFNASQGIFIFVLFVCRRSVFRQICKNSNVTDSRPCEHRMITRAESAYYD